MSFHPSGKYLALGMISASIALLDMQTGDMIFSQRAHKRRVWDVAFNADGTMMLSGGEDGAIVYRLEGYE